MEKLQLHLTKKTAGIACAAVGAALLIGMGGCYAAGQIAQNNSIDAAAAQSFAFVDAGVMPENAQVIKSKFDYDDGIFYYDVEFVADGVYYDYDIKAADGTVLKKDMETVKGYQATQVTQPGSGSTQAATQLSADEAYQKALAEAGVKEADAFLKKNHIDWENGTQVYEVEFYVKNADGSVTEYEYAVNAETGDVVERGMEQERVQTVPQPKPQAPAQAQPGSGSTQAPAPQQPQPAPQQPQPAPQQPASQQGNLITVDEAKNIALSHAGVGSGATFVKTELDHDDGRMVYEIEFYVDWTEYNVDVDAVSGTVVGFDIDYEDYD